MIYVYKNKKHEKTLLMLHGTGGNEHEMVKLGERINNEYNILSIRGNVVENGMNRYFKRSGIGNYDLNSYINEVNYLTKTIKKLVKKYEININEMILVGFSNGANIGLGILQENQLLNNYVLLSPDFINKDKGINIDGKGKNVFISTADNDPYVNVNSMNKLINDLTNSNVNLEVLKTSGHQINLDVLNKTISYVKDI